MIENAELPNTERMAEQMGCMYHVYNIYYILIVKYASTVVLIYYASLFTFVYVYIYIHCYFSAFSFSAVVIFENATGWCSFDKLDVVTHLQGVSSLLFFR